MWSWPAPNNRQVRLLSQLFYFFVLEHRFYLQRSMVFEGHLAHGSLRLIQKYSPLPFQRREREGEWCHSAEDPIHVALLIQFKLNMCCVCVIWASWQFPLGGGVCLDLSHLVVEGWAWSICTSVRKLHPSPAKLEDVTGARMKSKTWHPSSSQVFISHTRDRLVLYLKWTNFYTLLCLKTWSTFTSG